MSSHCSILNLPIEILDFVYKFIPDMKEKLNLARVHWVLGRAFALHVGDTFKEIQILEPQVNDWSDILALCGSSVTTIKTEDSKAAMTAVKLASMHCPNLEKLVFPVSSNSWNQIKSLLLTLENLSSIVVMDNFEKLNVVDTLLQLPKLTTVEFVRIGREIWKRVGELVNLTKLTIRNKEEELIDVFKDCSALKNLNSLELKYACIRMPEDHGDEQLMPKIEFLKIFCGTFYTALPYMPTLKDLQIENIDLRMKLTDIFGQSAVNYGKTLESLRYCPKGFRYCDVVDLRIIMKLQALKRLECTVVDDDCMNYISQLENLELLILPGSLLTNRGAMMVINRCKHLRLLGLNGCERINSYMVEEAVAALQHRRLRSDNPLVLHVSVSFGKVDNVS
ncbi:hypothetical protein KR054_003728 [Drosophila jambulina]|nr:hypothetical protein KR054_003728 [Drosophila jambulina]